MLSPINGFVLIDLDKDDHFDTGSGIEVPRFEVQETHYEKATTGLVVAVCNSLPYHGHQIAAMDPADVGYLMRKSVLFDVPIEVKVGDRVLFEWQALENEFAWVAERLLLVRYDQLITTIGVHPYPLNGRVLLEMDDKWQNGPLLEDGWNLGVEMNCAVVVANGCEVRDYLYFPGEKDCGIDFVGKRVLLSRQSAVRSQIDEYKTNGSSKKYPWYYCSRRDILGYVSV